MAHPPKPNSRPKVLARLQALVAALPDTVEKIAWGGPTFRVAGGRMFAMYDDHHHGEARVALWCRAPEGVQEMLVSADPQRFFRPPYVGPDGWIGIRLDGVVDWEEVADFLAAAHRLAMPVKKKRARRS